MVSGEKQFAERDARDLQSGSGAPVRLEFALAAAMPDGEGMRAAMARVSGVLVDRQPPARRWTALIYGRRKMEVKWRQLKWRDACKSERAHGRRDRHGGERRREELSLNDAASTVGSVHLAA